MTPKQVLRAEMRARRRTYVSGLPSRAMLLRALRDLVLPRLPVEGIVASYSAYGDEIDPAPVAAALPGRAALPWFAGRDAPMRFRLWDGGPLDSGPFNIPQPTHGEFVDPDILLVPLVAADPRCHRLGQGKGHYDRALAALAGHKTLHTIGLAWEVQLIAEVPTDPWDIPLDAIATPLRWLTPVA